MRRITYQVIPSLSVKLIVVARVSPYGHEDFTPHFLHDSNPRMANKTESWRQIVDLQAKAFKPQGENFPLVFRGSVYTDRFGVSIVKCNQETRAGGPRIQPTGTASRDTYIDDPRMNY